MARFTLSMNLSLDGYVDHDRFAPDPVLFQHWIDAVDATPVSIYGRKIYELMRYWEVDQPGWGPGEFAFATAWRAQEKHVVSQTLTEVGPNARLIATDIEANLHRLKADLPGEVEVSGTQLVRSMGQMGLIDEYRLYYHPVVLGQGRPLFPGPLPRLRLTDCLRIGTEVMRLTYVPAEEMICP